MYAPGPPYCTYGLRVPASCVLYVPEAQGSRRTRTSPGRAVRTAYRGTTGDSYADNFDMGFECWQTLLGRQCRLSSLNVACGGARISEYRSQLVTATAACEELGLTHSAETLVVVHAGGNDFLQALVLPPLLLLLLLDIVRCGARRALGLPRFDAASPPLLSFVGLSAR